LTGRYDEELPPHQAAGLQSPALPRPVVSLTPRPTEKQRPKLSLRISHRDCYATLLHQCCTLQHNINAVLHENVPTASRLELDHMKVNEFQVKAHSEG
jgi:hypothetical protein